MVDNEIKKALRITSDAFDDEISMLKSAAVEDLTSAGIASYNDNMYQLAVIHFCKAHFGSGIDSEKHQKCYESLKSYLMQISKIRIIDDGNNCNTD